MPVSCWNPDGWVAELEPGDEIVVVGPGSAPVLPAGRRHRLTRRARGRCGRPGADQAAGPGVVVRRALAALEPLDG